MLGDNDDQIRRAIRAQVDEDVAAFIAQLGEDVGSGVPPPPQIRITEVSSQPYEFDIFKRGKQRAETLPTTDPSETVGCPDEEVDEVTVTFAGIVPCPCLGSGSESFLGTDLGDLNGTPFVLPRISSTAFQLTRAALYRVTKYSPNTDCTGDIEYEHESDVVIFASCNPATGLWTVAIQDQVDFFFAFFGRSTTMPIPAEGICDFPSSPDLFHEGTAVVSF